MTGAEAWTLTRRVMAAARATPILAEAEVHLSPAEVRDGAFLRADWRADRAVCEEGRAMLDLYLPICLHARAVGRRPFVIAHLGQSLDGRIATPAGESEWVTGKENLTHMHRLRALCDAVMVGAGTVRDDDPRLTVRSCEGENPARIVVDTDRRLDAGHTVFTDGRAATFLMCDAALVGSGQHGRAEVIGAPRVGDRLDSRAILDALADRGIGSLFLEGGGVTVSRFVEAGCVNRLHIAVAPTIIGSGRPGLSLPPVARMDDAMRPPARVVRQGPDVLFDCVLDA